MTETEQGNGMKAGINQWIFPGDMPTQVAMDQARQMGFDAFEVCVGDQGPVHLDASEGEITAIRKHADSLGLEICSVGCGMGWSLPLSSPDETVRAQGKEATGRALQIAQWLGTDAVLVVPGVVTPEVSYEMAIENSFNAIQDLVPVAEKLGVAMGLENVWNKFLLSPTETRDFIDQFESEYVGAYFDLGNILLYGYPEQWIRILGDRLLKIHAKDFRTAAGGFSGFVMLLEGDVNWPAVMGALKDVGFEGALTAEYGAYPHAFDTTLKHCHDALRAILAM